MLKKAKKPETSELKLCRQEKEIKDELEDAGDSTLVGVEKLENFGPRDDEHQEESQQELAVGEPKTQDKSVQTMDIAEVEEMKEIETAREDDSQSKFSYISMAMYIVAFVFLIAACIDVFNFF